MNTVSTNAAPGTPGPAAAEPSLASAPPLAPKTASARRGLTVTWHQQHKKSLTTGERAADTMRNSMGSWRFVGGFVLFMILWAVANSFASGWDPYPFILLNLFLSMLAGLQGAILLISAKRQDAIAAALAQHDFDTNIAAKTDIEALLEINNRQLAMIGDLQAILERLDLPTRSAGPTPATND
ncbi:Protein of unknown function [Cryobacterium flavum]|uniref:DUF1003 domain-containing protein n=2 Tax=Cryobacterium flavum TaxID=1424659 RepID=A0A5E9FVP9_9MICO|nr:Protein of unknown function [Cryobacterium flavum]